MKYITISNNAEVGVTEDRDDDDALLLLPVEEAKALLLALTLQLREIGAI